MKKGRVLLVNESDKISGYASLDAAHLGKGKHHRAFVTLLFDSKNRVLLQRRKHKLFDGFWDFTAISHPLQLKDKAESYQEASDRALKKEMGIDHVTVKKIGGFNYFAKDGSSCENEYCAVLIGTYDGAYQANRREVYEDKKIAFREFILDIKKNPKIYAPWAVLASEILENKPLDF